MDKVVAFAKAEGKEVMIAESTPFGGIEDPASSDWTWDAWFGEVLSYIERHDIRYWSYINADWDSQPMWKKNNAEMPDGVHWVRQG